MVLTSRSENGSFCATLSICDASGDVPGVCLGGLVSPIQPPTGAVEEASHMQDDVATWLHENEFIQTGYRALSNSIKRSVQSIWAIHNETGKSFPEACLLTLTCQVNVWSHILGYDLFLVIPVYVFNTKIPPRYKVATRENIAVCTIYFTGLDYIGIFILIYSAMIPLLYYGFVCDHLLRNIYWGLVSILAGLCALFTMHRDSELPKRRLFVEPSILRLRN
ncbi:Uncharacterized protein HZ326_1527 [Fusarium oxysporum f. sp. albedinis]|nr:Uncharacterized protein HZ326_1527 [Fusarium oxysporum f. sp. albedinis]